MRLHNVVASVLVLALTIALLKMLNPETSQTALLLRSFALWSFPIVSFYSFLYYTDIGALATLLASYALLLNNQPLYSSLVQIFITNIIIFVY